MLLDPRMPLLVGSAMILLLGAYLAVYHPMPGELATPHARIPGIDRLDSCDRCHDEGGLTKGCLSCHDEIAAQIASKTGYHHQLSVQGKSTCTPCHVEHFGGDFPLINEISWGGDGPTAFLHSHVEFTLVGRHNEIGCEACHAPAFHEQFSLAAFPAMVRQTTFLGLRQECLACHEDIHSGGLSGACDECHGQDSFRPATYFHHEEFFPLEGGHERVECAGCHIIPERAEEGTAKQLPFDRVLGTECRECHESPHLAAFSTDCEECHPLRAPAWSQGARAINAEIHALTGFRLVAPHADVTCEKCHPPGLPFDQRFNDPSAAGYLRREDTCRGCHEDAHAGQFTGRYPRCLDCHEKLRFAPSRYGHERHALVFELEGPHRAVPCTSCHRVEPRTDVRIFVGTARECKLCHENPHGGQFRKELQTGDCVVCHGEASRTFAIRPFDHAERTGYALVGAHAKASCELCHRTTRVPPATASATVATTRLYRGTSSQCSACHKDSHKGQFNKDGVTLCDSCHKSTTKWSEIVFDHNTQSRFPLDGVHAKVPCKDCHVPVKTDVGTEVVLYKPLGTQCEDCHEVVPR